MFLFTYPTRESATGFLISLYILGIFPLSENVIAFSRQNALNRYAAPLQRHIELMINEIVVKTYLCGILTGVAIINM